MVIYALSAIIWFARLRAAWALFWPERLPPVEPEKPLFEEPEKEPDFACEEPEACPFEADLVADRDAVLAAETDFAAEVAFEAVIPVVPDETVGLATIDFAEVEAERLALTVEDDPRLEPTGAAEERLVEVVARVEAPVEPSDAAADLDVLASPEVAVVVSEEVEGATTELEDPETTGFVEVDPEVTPL